MKVVRVFFTMYTYFIPKSHDDMLEELNQYIKANNIQKEDVISVKFSDGIEFIYMANG